jgi:catechol 2,3-dioxygenase-like lactoylglutathione lyase family enzyme
VRIGGVYETALYGRPVGGLAAFYRETLGLRQVQKLGETGVAFRLDDGGVLLLFEPERESRPDAPPAHGATGPGHVAFTVAPGDLARWVDALRARGIELEHEQDWGAGGRSIYFRDPAGNSIELIEGEAWPP